MKQVVYSSMMIALILCATTSVDQEDKCKSCTDMKSEKDCGNFGGCSWNSQSSCVKSTVAPPTAPVTFCSKIGKSKCSQTVGCALVNNECILFSGCETYVSSTLEGCFSISTKCVSDGTSCVNAADCSSYPEKICEKTVNSKGRQCKWDSNTCRDYQCSEAKVSLTTDRQCDAFSAGCVTTGQGCLIPPLPSCSTYTGTAGTCLLMKGIDNNCEYDSLSQKCKAKQCQNAPTSTNTDAACNTYQVGCVSTGKGCKVTLNNCSSYSVTNPQSDCEGYIGLDGKCEGDSGATTCRSRICDNGIGSTDKACNDYKKGCISNGIKCATSKSQCSNYQGTITTCQQYLATDGNCKGTSDTEGACVLKDCLEDSDSSFITDEMCQSNIQSWCISTGRGCVKTLDSCTTYTAEADVCFTLTGSEGKCTVGTSGQCAPRTCESAPNTYTTNEECAYYFTNCVTNGSGCVLQTTCLNTMTQLTCSGTKEDTNTCTWSPICISNSSCSSFTLQSICIQNLAAKIEGSHYQKQACKWDKVTSTCVNASCTDYTGSKYSTNEACDNVFPGCVTNGSGCVDPYSCSTSFQGTKATCMSLKAYCTNTDLAASTDPCIQRTCADSGLTYHSDEECIKYLPGCLTNGNGCISETSTCSGYQGTQNQCHQFYGYYNGKVKGMRCWNTSLTVSQCIQIQCIHASGMKNDSDCNTFLKGCLFDGNTSCVDKSASCNNYKYTTDPSICQAFKGVDGTILCYQGTSNQCKNRECTDNTTATKNSECNEFLSGCLTKGTGCVLTTEPCASHVGTVTECNQYVGNSKQCTKVAQAAQSSSCKAKLCSDKDDATSNLDCVNYHSDCRLVQGSSLCQDADLFCGGYRFQDYETTANKAEYCHQVTNKRGGNCSNSYSACIERTECTQWSANSKIDCVNYLGANTCSFIGGLCQAIVIQTCEDIESPTSAVSCNTSMNSGKCQYYNSKCYTTQSDCSGYSLTGIASGSESDYCSVLTSYQNGVAYKCAYNVGTPSNCIFSIIAATSFDSNQIFSTCENIREPTNQANCDSLAGSGKCTYLLRNCYTIANCVDTVIPTKFTTLDQRKLFCMNMKDKVKQKFCTFVMEQSNCGSALLYDCEDLPVSASDKTEYCHQRNGEGYLCIYDSGYNPDTCATTYPAEGCEEITNAISEYDCYIRTTINACVQSPSGKCVQKKSDCSKFSYTGTTADEKAIYCQHYKNTSNNYCSWISAANCETSKNSCADWDGLTPTANNLSFCSKRIAKDGTQCSYIAGYASCSNFVPPKNSQADCDFYFVGTIYNNGTCNSLPSVQGNCNLYTATGSNDDQKFTFCNLLYSSDNTHCTLIQGSTNCINKGACNTYDVSSLTDNISKQTACKAIKTTDEKGCIYLGTGNNCSAMISGFSTCELVTGATDQLYCDAYISNCFYYSSKCYTLSETCNYATGGSGAIAFCNAMKNSIGDYCKAASDTAANCIQRTCSDTATTTMTTNEACKTYKKSCKSDGTKCIDSSVACSTQTLSDCTTFLDTDNITQCINSAAAPDNATCVDATSLCSSYTGTLSNCQNYAGTGGQCWGDSESISGACRDKKCIYKLTATTNSECYDFLSGCLYNGVGCVDKSAQCSSYQGTINTCKNYKGSNGSVQCWSNSESISSCKEKECSNLAGTDDQTCANFIPAATGAAPKCVTDGSKCVPYPKNCSDFSGTTVTCSQFTALDGPCKASSSSSSCAPRVCSEAPSSLHTDEQCKAYYPNCITNGNGCINQDIGCSGIPTQNVCSSNISCTWAYSCKLSKSTCKEIVEQPTCANTVLANGTHCFWGNGSCRNITCTDYDLSLTTHQQCQEIDKRCTTRGGGCVTLGTCNSYFSSSICNAANTTESSIRCTWDGNTCRQRVCTDFAGTTDYDCNTFLSGCKSSGSKCIGSIYECQIFNGNKSLCIQDSNGNQCLYLNDICYTYPGCQDIPYSDFEICQSVSKNCVPSANNCIAKRPCENYNEQISCVVGINDQTCGWMSSTNKCQVFSSCADYQSSFQFECQLYGSKCYTDGSICITQTDCSSYLTQTACNNKGTDGFCTWNDSTKNCRLRECSDLNGTTDSSCASFIVGTGICTTNGIKCIPRANCQEYANQMSCTIDIQGNPCLFTYPVGSTSGIQSCRAKDCSDISGITNQSCISQLNEKPCVSNGKTCVKQDTCASYKNLISCNGGGSDGICAFTPKPLRTDLLAGTCTLFDSCEKANKDEIACKKNSAACIWSSTIKGTTTTTSCSPLTCAQKAIGTICNPVSNFNGSKYTICSLQNNVCSISDPSNLTSELCYLKSQYTYTWNQSSQKCESCKNSTNDTPVDNHTIQNNTTIDQFGLLLNMNTAIYLTAIMLNI